MLYVALLLISSFLTFYFLFDLLLGAKRVSVAKPKAVVLSPTQRFELTLRLCLDFLVAAVFLLGAAAAKWLEGESWSENSLDFGSRSGKILTLEQTYF